MKICIAGKNNIAVDILKFLLEEKNISNEQIVVTCNKSETGKNTWQRSLRLYAKQSSIREVKLEELYLQKDLLLLSLEYDRIINPELFVSNDLYNIHFSMLPQYKGMYTSALPILNNEKISGVTFHKIDHGIDTGNIISQKSFMIGSGDTARDLYFNYIKYGTELAKDTIERIFSKKNTIAGVLQGAENSVYYSKKVIDYQNLKINLNQTALGIYNQIRAFNFREYQLPIVYSEKINNAQITRTRSRQRAGTIIWKSDDRMLLSTIDYNITLFYDQFEPVLAACKCGNLNDLKCIPNLPLYINQQGENGWTPLMVATYNNHYDIVMFLLSEGADINIVNWNGTNLLMYAKEAYRMSGDSRLFELLYGLGVKNEKDYDGKDLVDYCQEQKIEAIGPIRIIDGDIRLRH